MATASGCFALLAKLEVVIIVCLTFASRILSRTECTAADINTAAFLAQLPKLPFPRVGVGLTRCEVPHSPRAVCFPTRPLSFHRPRWQDARAEGDFQLGKRVP